MAAADRAQYERAIASRIARDDAETPWLTLPTAMADLDDLMIDADPEHVTFLRTCRAPSLLKVVAGRTGCLEKLFAFREILRRR